MLVQGLLSRFRPKHYGFVVAAFSVLFLCRGISTSQMIPRDYYCSFEVIGYYPDYWQIPVPTIQYDNLTEVVFFSIYPNPDATINTSQIDLDRQEQFIQAAHARGVQVLICVGGWGLSENFSIVASNPSLRRGFIESLGQYCLNYAFDGIVLDWEPVTPQADRDNYTLLIHELGSVFKAQGKTVSVAVSALGSEFNPSCINDIDRLHVMAYDMSSDPAEPHSTYDQAVQSVLHWQNFGFSPQQIILGLPFYGRDTQSVYHAYQDIVAEYAPGREVDEIAGINFNGIDTIRQKTRYMLELQCRGVMFWELTGDTADHTSLLTAISDEILLSRSGDTDCNGFIDSVDLECLLLSWFAENCRNENAWCQVGDLDQSGRIDIGDFAIFADFWLAE